MSTLKIPCPCCTHEETLRARRNGGDPEYDSNAVMYWNRPYGGARGQQCTEWDGGWWRCDTCGLRLYPRAAAVLLDAALAANPGIYSTDSDGYYALSKVAARGGPV